MKLTPPSLQAKAMRKVCTKLQTHVYVVIPFLFAYLFDDLLSLKCTCMPVSYEMIPYFLFYNKLPFGRKRDQTDKCNSYSRTMHKNMVYLN